MEDDIAKSEGNGFVVQRAKFYYDKSGFLTEPVIDMTVQNGTAKAVSRAYFHGVVTSPGRSVPWVEDD
ncbi:MAG: hypothetical protein ACYC5Y_10335 [Symbiobacteriia bacterium]